MDCYEIWCDLRNSHNDIEFSHDVEAYMSHLISTGLVNSYRLTRRKLGFGPKEMGEFHITIETENLAQLEEAFQTVAQRAGETEKLHARVYSAVTNSTFALYRDFPDPVRLRTNEPK
mgnify:CR=1 FL=1